MGEIIWRRDASLVSRRMQSAIAEVADDMRIEEAGMRAKSALAEYAMSKVTYLKHIQGELEKAVPDATEALAVIANATAMSIAEVLTASARR
ncbi:hypothetical protein [Streptomyces sp. NPDC050504]|uniref:hypothetical protein n=1 Tax=Streptomyces sp. NPDC050504 TaxID=3365618 RepID=UPI003796562E